MVEKEKPMSGITIIRSGSKEHTPEYWVWRNMKKRCLNVNSPNYKYYGGRGVRVCREWLGPEGFMHFLSDMGERPVGIGKGGRALYSINRVGNTLVYSKETCEWTTQSEQCAPGQRRPRGRAADYMV
jgi:hypothetical protein